MSTIEIPELTRAEATYIVSVLNGIGCSHDTLVANLAVPLDPDAIGWDHIDTSGFNGHALLAKLASWTPEERTALLDAVDLFWSIGHVPDFYGRLHQVGLTKDTSSLSHDLLDLVKAGIEPVLHYTPLSPDYVNDPNDPEPTWCCHDQRDEMFHTHGNSPEDAVRSLLKWVQQELRPNPDRDRPPTKP